MVEDQGKQEEEKFDFTREGEALGYISLDQARVLAMRTASETPGAYGLAYRDVPMAFEVVEAEETEDHYVITITFRPQGEFTGRPGREQFFIEKEGGIALRQILALPSRRRRLPIIPAAVALAVAGAIAVIAVFAVGGFDGGGDGGASVPAAAIGGPAPTSALAIAPTVEATAIAPSTPRQPTPGPTVTTPPAPAAAELQTATAFPTPTPISQVVEKEVVVTATPAPRPTPTPTPTLVPVTSRVTVTGASLSVLGARPPVGLPAIDAQDRLIFQGLTNVSALILARPPTELHTSASGNPPRVRFQGLSQLLDQLLGPLPSELTRVLQGIQ